jgi:tetratricopeptide (TPR) repeat protein
MSYPGNHMPAPIFISYAHGTSQTEARALKAQLGDQAFLDETEIPTRARFTEVIAKSLMEARLAVVFADDACFDRPYCRWEWSLILRARGTDHVYVTVAAGAVHALDALSPDLRTRNWSTPDLFANLQAHLQQNPPLIGSLIDEQDREYLLESSWQQAQLPPVLTEALASIPHRWLGLMDESSQARFVGRADLLNQLHQHLWLRHMGKASAVALTAAVHGAGGFGKSRLAAEYVHRYAPACFKGGIFWMQCETELESQFHEVVQALDPETPPINVLRQNQVNIPKLLRDKVQSVVRQGKPVLFVLDNVPEVEGKLPKLETYCPAKGLAAVLITSRQRQGQVETLDVDALTPEAAWLILTANLPRRSELTRKEWNEISEWVGRLPLALEILNRALVNGARPVGEILRRARHNETTSELDELAEALPEIQRGVTETFEISYRALSAEGQKAARLLAELGPDPIPEILLETLEITSPKVRAELTGHAFVAGVAGDAIFGTMHRVLASFLREKSRLGGELVEVEHFGAQRADYAAAVRAVEKVFEYKSDLRNPRDWKLLGSVRPHAEFLSRVSEFGLATLGVWLGLVASAQGNLPGARKIRERVLEVSRRVLGEEHPDTLTSMNNLSHTLWFQGDLAGARQIQEQVLDVRRRVQGEEHPDTLTSMQSLAMTFWSQGDLPGAREIEEQVLNVRRRVQGEEHPDTLTSMHNLARTLKDQGDLAGARKIQEEVMDIRRRVLGEDHPNTLTSMSDIAQTLIQTGGDRSGARKIQEQVLDVSRRALGEEHPLTVTFAWNLFRTLEDLKAEDAAKRVFNAHLVPLLQRDPVTLSADSRWIQSQVRDLSDPRP